MSRFAKVRERLLKIPEKMGFVGPLLIRLTLGVVFVGTGWGKLHDLDKVTQFFIELGIPAPHFQAMLVAFTEFAGGLCILLGLATRLAALPLMFTMIVAILTAKRGDIDGVSTLLGFEEWSYLVMFAWLAIAGPGKASLDHLIVRRLSPDRFPKPLLRPQTGERSAA
jgi:putative oxidoreductase